MVCFGAYLYIIFTKKFSRKTITGIICTIISIIFIYILKSVFLFAFSQDSFTKWQVDFRFLLSFIYLGIILSTILASKWYRSIFNNRLVGFLAIISYNMFIYHHELSVRLKFGKIPFWDGEELPNIAGNEEWKAKYVILCTVLILLISIATTFLIERPSAKIIKRKMNKI